MNPADVTKARIAGIFDRASITYGRVGPDYFAYFGERLVLRAGLAPGMRVLNVACGRGAVLFPAAQAVGDTGSVIGVDLSEGMIRETNAEIAARGLRNVTAQVMDGERLTFPAATFDAVTCAFALFFMTQDAALAAFRRVLRPGGRLALSIWAPASDTPTEVSRWQWYDDLLKRYLPAAPTSSSDPTSPASAIQQVHLARGPARCSASSLPSNLDAKRAQVDTCSHCSHCSHCWRFSEILGGTL